MVIEFAREVFIPLGEQIAGDVELWTDPRGRRLSDRVWLAGDEVRRQIDQELRRAIATGEDPVAVARRLEQYLDPGLAPVRDPETGRLQRYQRDGRGRIKRDARGRPIFAQPKGAITRTPRGGGGSYPARRLARTEISRAFAQATLQAAEANPFVEGAKWNLSGTHKDADACDENARRSSRSMERGGMSGEPETFANFPALVAELDDRIEMTAVDETKREDAALSIGYRLRFPNGMTLDLIWNVPQWVMDASPHADASKRMLARAEYVHSITVLDPDGKICLQFDGADMDNDQPLASVMSLIRMVAAEGAVSLPPDPELHSSGEIGVIPSIDEGVK